jgi:HD superfamily phosphohydrolase
VNLTKGNSSTATYLDTSFYHPVRDPVWGNIMLSEGFKKIVSSPVLQKMNRIRQLGPTYLVYPGAVHTRFIHSLGVYHIGYRMIRRLITFDSCPAVSVQDVNAFLCACLLHDLGHFPYTHSLKELPLKKHEALTGEYILAEPLASIIRSALEIDPVIPAAIVDTALPTSDATVKFFRNILSGVLDPDKLDYLTRDAFFCGVPYGTQDIEFVLSSIYPHPERGISILPSGIPAVENILFSKYLMYKTVYWHKTVRCATGMIKKAIMAALNDGVLTPDDLYGLDDESLFQAGRGDGASRLFDMVHGRELFKMTHEVVFDDNNPYHMSLLDLKKRGEEEAKLAEKLACDSTSVIIDVPENITFETTLPVYENGSFRSFSGRAGLETFSDPLRKIRIFVDPSVAQKARGIQWN